jgi:hypothetical protein
MQGRNGRGVGQSEAGSTFLLRLGSYIDPNVPLNELNYGATFLNSLPLMKVRKVIVVSEGMCCL